MDEHGACRNCCRACCRYCRTVGLSGCRTVGHCRTLSDGTVGLSDQGSGYGYLDGAEFTTIIALISTVHHSKISQNPSKMALLSQNFLACGAPKKVAALRAAGWRGPPLYRAPPSPPTRRSTPRARRRCTCLGSPTSWAWGPANLSTSAWTISPASMWPTTRSITGV